MISMLIIELSQSGPYLESFTIYSDTMFDSSQLLLCIYNVLYGNYNVILQYCIILLILYVIESGSARLNFPPNLSIWICYLPEMNPRLSTVRNMCEAQHFHNKKFSFS